MAYNSEIIHVFFRIFNFLLLIGLGAYVLVRYMLEPIKEKIREKKRMLSRHQKDYRDLKKKYKEEERLVEQQSLEAARLHDKVVEWQARARRENEYMLSMYEQYVRAMHKRIDVQRANWACYQMQGTIVPRAVDEAQEMLEQKFSDEKIAHKYFDLLIGVIKEQQR